MCASARSAVAHPSRFDLSCGVKRSHLRTHARQTHEHVCARERDRPPTHHPPRRKSHRINVRDQRLSISYRAFLSISAAAYNDSDSKAADYEINVRFATLATLARVHNLSVSPVRVGGSDCTRPLWWVFSVRAQTASKPATLTLRWPSMERSDFRRNMSAVPKFSFNFARNVISIIKIWSSLWKK